MLRARCVLAIRVIFDCLFLYHRRILRAVYFVAAYRSFCFQVSVVIDYHHLMIKRRLKCTHSLFLHTLLHRRHIRLFGHRLHHRCKFIPKGAFVSVGTAPDVHIPPLLRCPHLSDRMSGRYTTNMRIRHINVFLCPTKSVGNTQNQCENPHHTE